ncbi:TipAS antibiotic-recognition domain-containing protein [Stackebrandtia albiflava]|uniref:TipAS antibiotic-recognition domain-containing protein n=1 Tax=Stackebrandtia albiflava TaxID=406432 RepID=UPI0011BEDF7E|nr:TipAS antibiotic-recognition domain-containing protein [Stackebrandtia albiflava]
MNGEDFAAVGRRLVALREQGAAPSDGRVQDVVAEHHRLVSRHWTPDAAGYVGLARLYRGPGGLRAFYDRIDPDLADFHADAMEVYAATTLAGDGGHGRVAPGTAAL